MATNELMGRDRARPSTPCVTSCAAVQRAQRGPGGVLGKFFDPAASGKRNLRAGGATIRAMGSVDISSDEGWSVSGSSSSSSGSRQRRRGDSSSGGRNGRNGSGSGKQGRRGGDSSSSGTSESSKSDSAAPKTGGLRSFFGRK